MRAINITGKHNIDKMNELDDANYQAVRKHMSNIAEAYLAQPCQFDLLKRMYLPDASAAAGAGAALTGQGEPLLKSELLQKIQGYKGQDIKKEVYDSTTLITLDEVIEKLVASKLRCCYCSTPVFILYKNVRDPAQWTLDRNDNSLGHTSANTCIACLKCNLQRRVLEKDVFSFTKKLRIKKV
jgi:hypothetical protein